MAVNDMVFSTKELREYAILYKKFGITVGEWISRKPKRKLSEIELVNAILRVCCEVTKAEFTRVLSRSRLREDVLARQFAMHFLKEKLPLMRLKTIGRYYCRDHSTVSHSLKEVGRIINPKYKDPASELFFRAQKEIAMNLEMYVA